MLLLTSNVSVAFKPAPPLPPFEVSLARAKGGDVAAQFRVGMALLEGAEKVERNPVEAAKWFSIASDNVGAEAARSKWILGEMIYYGFAVSTDKTKGLALLREAAEAELSAATAVIGERYFQAGRYKEALPWVRKQTQHNISGAFSKLALMYLYGDGLPQSDENAGRHFCLAAFNHHSWESGGEAILFHLAALYAEGRGFTQNREYAAILASEASKRGVDFSKTLFKGNLSRFAQDTGLVARLIQMANQGDVNASYSLGLAYRFGRGTQANNDLAIHHLTGPADAGNADAQFHLAEVLSSEPDEFRDDDKIHVLLRKAAEQNHLLATNRLGTQLMSRAHRIFDTVIAHRRYHRAGFAQMSSDLAEARTWLEKASRMGHANAYVVMGSSYAPSGVDGYPRIQREDSALLGKYKKLAAERGDLGAQYFVAQGELTGAGRRKDERSARRGFELVASQPIVFNYHRIREARLRLQEFDGNWFPGLVPRAEPCSHVNPDEGRK